LSPPHRNHIQRRQSIQQGLELARTMQKQMQETPIIAHDSKQNHLFEEELDINAMLSLEWMENLHDESNINRSANDEDDHGDDDGEIYNYVKVRSNMIEDQQSIVTVSSIHMKEGGVGSDNRSEDDDTNDDDDDEEDEDEEDLHNLHLRRTSDLQSEHTFESSTSDYYDESEEDKDNDDSEDSETNELTTILHTLATLPTDALSPQLLSTLTEALNTYEVDVEEGDNEEDSSSASSTSLSAVNTFHTQPSSILPSATTISSKLSDDEIQSSTRSSWSSFLHKQRKQEDDDVKVDEEEEELNETDYQMLQEYLHFNGQSALDLAAIIPTTTLHIAGRTSVHDQEEESLHISSHSGSSLSSSSSSASSVVDT
jgi:hypothetical protein